MLILDLFAWWYSTGWQQAARGGWRRLIKVSHIFSVPILLRTLWAPWRRIVTYPGASIDARLRALGDNLVSRLIGFSVRMLVLIAAGLILFLTACLTGLQILLWPLVPLLIITGLIGAVVG